MSDHIYRTSDRRVLSAWDEMQRDVDAYRERRKQALASWGFDPDIALYVSNSVFGGARWCGVVWPEDQEPPKYWRRDSNTRDMIVPRRAGAAGKRVSDEFSALASVPSGRAKLSKLGMPDMVMRGEFGRMYATSYAAVRLVGEVWVRWTVDPNPSSPDDARDQRVNGSIWESVPLSEYYALVETGVGPFGDPS